MAERSLLDTVVGIASLAGLLAGGIWYATGLQNQLESAQREIAELRSRLETVSSNTATVARGEKGEQGERGETGPKGEKGDRGPPGAGGADLDAEGLREMVDRLVAEQVALLKIPTSSSQAATTTFVDSSGTFDLAKCIPVDQLRSNPSVTVKEGSEFCGADGQVLMVVGEVRVEAKKLFYQVPGDNLRSATMSSKTKVEWEKRPFVVQRFAENADGEGVATIRFVDG